jgi:hypothetical protein
MCIHAARNMQSLIQRKFSVTRNQKITILQLTINQGQATNTPFPTHAITGSTPNLITQIREILRFKRNLKDREIIIHHQSRTIVFRLQTVQTGILSILQNRAVVIQHRRGPEVVTLRLHDQVVVIQHQHVQAVTFQHLVDPAGHPVDQTIVRQEEEVVEEADKYFQYLF